MTAANLCDTLHKEVFKWAGLPEAIIVERDLRMTAFAVGAWGIHMQVELKFSTAYPPQTRC